MRGSVCALLLTACSISFSGDGSAQSDLIITLQRTACYGTCPVYKVTVRGDGSITYEGNEFVRLKGIHRTKVDPAAVVQLAQAFVDAGYFEFDNEYRVIHNSDGTISSVTDLPTTYTSISFAGRHKQIEDYAGAPEKLKELEKKIDELAGSKRWVNRSK